MSATGGFSRSYDYVIVGGGSAGCVLAARLSAEADRKVLLLEAGGPDDHFLLRMPLGFLRALFRPEFSWGYFSEPEPHLDGRRVWLPRGKVLGGSGSINGMFYMRGHSQDFDTWRNLGCEGWGYQDVLPYFRRMETSWRGAGPYHGDSGPLPVTPIKTEKLLHEPLMQTAAAAGFNVTDDLHGAIEEGFARGEVNIDRHGRRASTSRAYLHPVMGRENLEVQTRALTTRVLFDKDRAIGVEYVQNGQVVRVFADREVILCGGTYNTPQLLMLSGVGPAAELLRHGITPVIDLPASPGHLLERAALRPTRRLGDPVGDVRHRGAGQPDQQLQCRDPHTAGSDAAGCPADVQPGAHGCQGVVPGGVEPPGGSHHRGCRDPASEESRARLARIGEHQRRPAHPVESLRASG
jgi:choline dehydrogenase